MSQRRVQSVWTLIFTTDAASSITTCGDRRAGGADPFDVQWRQRGTVRVHHLAEPAGAMVHRVALGPWSRSRSATVRAAGRGSPV